MEKRLEEMIAALYDETFREMWLYARAVLRDEGLAEEAVQESFRVACNKAEFLAASANQRGWLFLVLRNTCKHIQRSRSKLLRNLAEAAAEEKAQTAADFSEPNFLYGDLAQDRDFRLLQRFAVEGYSIKELAEEYGISVAACKQRLARARQRYRRILSEGESDEKKVADDVTKR